MESQIERNRRGLDPVRLEQQNDFETHLLTYLLVNSILTLVWAIAGGGFFWPIFLIAAWGIAVLINSYFAFRGQA